MKRKLFLLIALSVLTVFIGLLYLKFPNSKQNQQAATQEESIELVDIKTIQHFKVKNENGEFIFTKSDGTEQWEVNGQKVVDVTKTQGLLALLGEVKLQRKMPSSEESQEAFGLEEPKTIVTVNEEEVLSLGHKTPTTEGYYSKINKLEGNVIVPIQYSKFVDISNDFTQAESERISDVSNIEEIAYRTKDSHFTIKRYKEKKDQHFSEYYFEEPYKTNPQVEAEQEDFTRLIDFIKMALPSLEFKNLEGLSEEELGLKEPNMELVIRNEEKEVKKIIVGNESEKEKHLYYAKFNENDQIHQIVIDNAEQLFGVNATKLAIQAPLYTFIDKISTLEIKHRGKKYTIDLSESANEEFPSYLVNNIEVDQKKIKEMYLSLLELNADAEIPEKLDSEQETIFEVTAEYDDGEITKVGYQIYDDFFYKIVVDDCTDFVISKDKFKKVFEQLENIEKMITD